MKKEIRFGIPKGSLNTVGRGNTYQLFMDAGYLIKGYEPGKESDKRLRVENDPEINVFLARPQSAPVELTRDLLDIAIVGEDWVREETVNMKSDPITRIGDLEYGQTRLVMALPKSSPYDSLGDMIKARAGKKLICFTEYPNLTRERIEKDKEYRKLYGDKRPLVQVRGLVDGDNPAIQVINSDGITEGYMLKGADLIVDNTQTGSTLREYGLRELETMMSSSAGLYAGPGCTGWKKQKAEEIYSQLYGALQGRQFFDVKFNVSNAAVIKVKDYLIGEKLCSNEPTVTPGEQYSAVNILIARSQFPKVLRVLRNDYQATAIVRNEVKQYIP